MRTVDDDDDWYDEGDKRSEVWCDLLNAIERRPDWETVFARAVATLKALVEAPVEESDWPPDLDC